MEEPDRMGEILRRGVPAILAAEAALPLRHELAAEVVILEATQARGYFLPDEDDAVRMRFRQYLGIRAALLETLEALTVETGYMASGWERQLPGFVAAFACACVLMRADRFLVDLAANRPVVFKKLDEEDRAAGVRRKTFTRIYRAMSNPLNAVRFLMAADFYRSHRAEIAELAGDPVVGRVVGMLHGEEEWIDRRRRDAVKRQVAYRRYTFLRRGRSAWKKVMFGMFEVSGRAVADLRQPGVKAAGAPKRITAEMRDAVLRRARPGDVFVTRHDDALSNLFLPGYWPHAALYLGTAEEAAELGVGLPAGGRWFLEAKKDGVLVRPAEETMQVDALVVARSPLKGEELGTALRRALANEGKPYDFLFDFRTADRLVCTEVVYRGFHGVGPVRFALREVGGRLCLPAEEFLNQAMDCGFRVVVAAGLQADRVMTGMRAELAFHHSRQPV